MTEPNSKLIHCVERRLEPQRCDEVHPGWVRATAILLRGLARLQDREPDK